FAAATFGSFLRRPNTRTRRSGFVMPSTTESRPVFRRLSWEPAVALVVTMVVAIGTGAEALEPIVAEDYCNRPGLTKPIRQSIVVLDQGLVVPNRKGEVSPQNQRWIKDIRSLLDPSAPGRVATFLPRERVSLYLAPTTGAQPTLLFTGCVPRF